MREGPPLVKGGTGGILPGLLAARNADIANAPAAARRPPLTRGARATAALMLMDSMPRRGRLAGEDGGYVGRIEAVSAVAEFAGDFDFAALAQHPFDLVTTHESQCARDALARAGTMEAHGPRRKKPDIRVGKKPGQKLDRIEPAQFRLGHGGAEHAHVIPAVVPLRRVPGQTLQQQAGCDSLLGGEPEAARQ